MNNNNLLIIDDEINVIASLTRLLKKENYTVFSATSGEKGLEILKDNDIAVIVSDLNMPGMDGLTFFEQISKGYESIVKIILTGQGSMESALASINRLQLFGYLTKPWPADEIKAMLRRAFEHYNLVEDNKRYQTLIRKQNGELAKTNEILEEKVRKRTVLLEDALREGIMMLATAAEEKDKETGNHLLRIRQISFEMCQAMNVPSDMSETISRFSVIHDVGKIHIPDKILNKPGPLDQDEWVVMKRHTTAGEKILGHKSYYTIARQIARSHHENWDGTGYPDGLAGNVIPLAARIIAVADVYDALTNKRPYKEAWEKTRAIQEMKRLSGIKFDPDILPIFIRLHEEGTFVL